MGLTRDQLLQPRALPRESVPMPEWGEGEEVWVRTISGTERDAFEQASIEVRGKSREANLRNIRARLCVLCMCDEQGKRILEDKDAEAFGAQPAPVLDRVFEVAQRLNGLGAKDVEALAKN